MKRLRAVWQSLWMDVDRRVRMGRVIGLTFMVAGFVLIFFAWNGSASKNIIMAQFPYLISGGVAGMALIVTGSLLLLLSTVRSERQILSDKFDEITRLLGRNLAGLQFSGTNGSGGELATKVVAASSHYHRSECKILEGKTGLLTVSLQQALAEGLQACRVCEPPRLPEQEVGDATDGETTVSEASGTPSRSSP